VAEVTHLLADEWSVVTLDADRHAEAAALVRQWHYSGSTANTSTVRHGLLDAEGTLQGAALWMPPTRDAARTISPDHWRHVLSLSRLVVAPDVPTNGASFLLGRAMRLLDRDRWPWLVTYADTRHGHSGAIYKATNWECWGPTRGAGDAWVGPDGEQRGRKRGGRTLRVAEMKALGFTQLPRCPKIKYVHTDHRAARRLTR
jgi:hypothetical protein